MTRDESLESPSPADDPDDEDRLGLLVGHYVERINAGERLTREEVRAEHPDLADRILERLELFLDIELGDGPRLEDVSTCASTLGDYTLRRELGRGGMGVVYEAWQNSLQRRVALKVLPAGIAAEAKSSSRFLREAQIAGRLHHAQIVPVYGCGVEANTPYYAMELIEGETLSRILERLRSAQGSEEDRRSAVRSVSRLLGWRSEARPSGGRASGGGGDGASPAVQLEGETQVVRPEEASAPEEDFDRAYCISVASAFAGVAEGLQHAHSHGVIHRDIKPSNLIVDEGGGEADGSGGRIRILDFGLARLEGQDSLTGSGEFVGTPLYMSPEQARARKVAIDHRTDVYSLGATLYEMLTLRPPFKGKDHQDTVSQILTQDPRPPRQINRRVPRDLETIALKCLRKDPGDRYGTAEALAQDLRRFARGDPIEARPQPLLEKVGRRLWRNRLRVAAACLAVLLLAAAGMLLQKDLAERHAARVALYREKIFSAIGKLELGRPARRAETRGAEGSRGGRVVASQRGPSESEKSDGMLLSLACAAEPAFTEALPDPVEEARDDLTEAADLLPERPEAHFHLARALKLLGREDAAKEALDRALGCNPGFLPALVERESGAGSSEETALDLVESALGPRRSARLGGQPEIVKESILAHRAKLKGDWGEAERALGKLLSLGSTSSGTPEPYLGFRMRTVLERGQARLEAGDADGALEDFSAARALWPELAEPVLLLGKAYLRRGDPARAEKRFEEFFAETRRKDEFALKVAGLHYDAGEYDKGLAWAEQAAESARREAWKAALFERMGRTDELLQAAKRAVELDPSLPGTHQALGMAWHRQGNFELAVAEHREAVRLDPTSASAHTNLGYALLDQQKVDEAVAEFREGVRLEPRSSICRYNLGNGLLEKGMLDEAIAEFKQAVRLDPGFAPAHDNLGLAFLRRHKLDEAIEAYRAAIQLEPEDPLSRCNLGIALQGKGKLEEAIEAYRKAVQLDPRRARSHHCLGSALSEKGQFQQAVDELREAVRLDLKRASTHNILAVALHELGRDDEAMAELREAIRLDPDCAAGHNNLGTALRNSGRLEAAIREYFEAIRLDPRNAMAHCNLGNALSEQDKLEEALTEFQEAIRLDPKLAHAHNALGIALRRQGKLEQAIAEFREAVSLDPKEAAFHGDLADPLRMLGRLEEAIAALRGAIRLDPNNATHHSNLGSILSSQGKQQEALGALREAIRLDPKLEHPHHSLGNLFARQGKIDEAIAELREAVRLDPKCIGAHEGLAYILSVNGQTGEALSELRKAVEVGDRDFRLVVQVLRSPQRPDVGREVEALIGTLEKIVEARPAPQGDAQEAPPGAKPSPLAGEEPMPGALQTLALAHLWPSPRRDPKKAIEYAERCVAAMGETHPGAVAFLAEVQRRADRKAEAIATLEKVVRLPGASPGYRTELEEYRKAALPDLPTPESIDAALERPEETTIIAKGAEWRFFRGSKEPSQGLAWAGLDFDDSEWEKGPSGIGYGDHDDATVLEDMRGNYTTVYIRRIFEVSDPGSLGSLTLRVAVDDGCVAYLNGTEVGRVRAGLPDRPLPHGAEASGSPDEPLDAKDLAVDPTLLRDGKNVLAIQGLNLGRDSSDFSLIPELLGEHAPHRGEGLKLHRAIRALEIAGSAEARSVLRTLSEEGPWLPGGPDARAALARLAERGAAADGGEGSAARGSASEPVRVYACDFQEAAGPEWSSRSTDVTPAGGRKFLGQFGNDRVTLSLAGLPEHRLLRLSFNLLAIRSWDGSAEIEGLDVFQVRVAGGPVLVRTTFASVPAGPTGRQAYPDDLVFGNAHPALGGASEKRALGYSLEDEPLDAVYPLELVFPHAAPSLELEFLATGLQGLDDESWGLDDVVVEALGAFEPPSEEEKGRLWVELSSADPLKANEALWRLVAAGQGGVEYVRERLEAEKGEREAHRRELLELDSRRFDAFRALAAGKGADRSGLLAYLDARILQRRGEHREAAAKLEEAIAGDPARPEPWLRLAESLRALGEPAKAEERLRQALRQGKGDTREVWDAWWAAAVEVKRPAEEAFKLVSDAAAARSESPASDLRWALERLSEEGAIRINCGGEEHRGKDGEVWGKDRFPLGGIACSAPSDRSVEGTEDDVLYRTERSFPKGLPCSYRIPLPSGRYRVSLGFAETQLREAGKRRFAVLLEGRTVLEDYEPKIDKAENFTFEQSVEDGHLYIEFVHKRDNPKIAAIAIERLP